MDPALRALDARISAEALAAAARLRSGRSDAAALPAAEATRRAEVFLETEVEVALEGFEAFLGRDVRMATPTPPGAAVTSTVFSLARPGGFREKGVGKNEGKKVSRRGREEKESGGRLCCDRVPPPPPRPKSKQSALDSDSFQVTDLAS